MQIDPSTLEWVFSDGTRLPVIAGGSVMNSDELPGRRRRDAGTGEDEIEVDLDSEDENDNRRDDDDDDDDDDRDGWEAPPKEEWERLKSALKNERRDRKKERREFDDKVKNMTTSGTAAAQVEIEKARIEERERVEKKWTKRTIRSEAAAMFAGNGATAKDAERLARMIDLDKVHFDDREEEFDGLEDEVDDIIAEHPEFFKKKERDDDDHRPAARRLPRVDGASRGKRGGAPRPKMTSADKLAAQALRKSPRR